MHLILDSQVHHPPTSVPWNLHNKNDWMTIVPLSKCTAKVAEMKSEPTVPFRHRDRSTCIRLPFGSHALFSFREARVLQHRTGFLP